jgi:hypothetical protein
MTDDPYRNARAAYRDLGLDFDEAEYLAASGRAAPPPPAPASLVDIAASLRRIADHLTGKETP